MAKSRSAKAIILASGQGLTRLVGLLSAVVLVRLFSKLDYATYRQTLLAFTFAAPFVTLGLDRALYYFLPTEKERPRGKLLENLSLLAAGGLLLTVFLLAGGNQLLARRFSNPELATTLLIFAPYPLLMLPATSLSACLLARERAGQVAVFNVISRLGLLLVVVIPCLLWPRPTVAITATVIGAALTTAVALMLMFRACSTGDWRPTLSGLWKQISYSIPLGLAGLASTIRRSVDHVLVAALCIPESYAVFSIGATRIPLVAIVTGSVSSVLIVDYTKLYREGRTSEIISLLHRAMVKCALILIPVMVFLLCVTPEFMRFLFGREYEDSAAIFRIYLLLLPLGSVFAGPIVMAAGKTHHVLVQSMIGLVFNVVATYYAVNAFGPIGAAIASVIVAYFVGMPYYLVVLSSILRCAAHRLYPWSDLLRIMLASVVPGFALGYSMKIVQLPDFGILALGGMLYALATLLLFAWFKLLSMSQLYASLRAACRWRSTRK